MRSPRSAIALGLAMATTSCAAIDRLLSPRAGEAGTELIEELASGARLVLHPSGAVPVAAILLSVDVGSADEAPDEAGIAQLFDGLVPAAIEAQVEALGGRLDSWTTHDQTMFEVVVPGGAAERALELLALAVLSPDLGADRVDREVGLRVARIRRSRGDPDRLLVERLYREAFRAHPYGRPVVGQIETVSKIGRVALSRFHRRWYVPANMTLVVSGGFDPAAIRERADRALASTRVAPPRPRRPVEPAQRETRVAILSEPVDSARVALGFHAPAAADPSLPALDLLFVILTAPNGRLATELRHRGVDARVGGTLHAPRDPGLLVLTARCPAPDVASILEAMAREAFRLRFAPPTPSELSRARRLISIDDAWPRGAVSGLARKLAWVAAVGRARFQAVGPEVVLDAARRTLVPRNTTVVALVPGDAERGLETRLAGAVTIASRLEEEAHREGRSEELAGGVVREVLPNGLRVLVQPDRTAPMAAVRIALLGGARAETDEEAGLSALLARVANQHASHEPGESLTVFSGRDSFGVDATFLSATLDDGLTRSVETLIHPVLDAGRILEARRSAAMEIGEGDPRSAAEMLAAATLFGSHPYGRSPQGSHDVVVGADRSRLEAFHSALIDPGRVVIAVVGDVEARRVLARLRDLMGDLRPALQPVRPIAEAPGPPSSRAVTAQRPGREAGVVVGFVGVRWTDRERVALEALATIVDSRIRRVLGNRGLALHTSASAFAGVDRGLFAVGATVAPENVDTATAAILAELGAMRASGPTPDELRSAKARLHAANVSSLETAAARAARLATAELLEGGAQQVWRASERIEALTAAELRRLARSQLAEGQEVVAVVGPDRAQGAQNDQRSVAP